MGGPGSGTWYRRNKKVYIEEVDRIDIRLMKRHDLLKPLTANSLIWSYRGKPTGKISFAIFGDRMILHYRYKQFDQDWQDTGDTVKMAKTPCHFGGSREWFVCPSCGKHVAVLYGPDKYFRCRPCTGMTYSSQSEGKLDRISRKARKIRHKLDIGEEWWSPDCLFDSIFFKPKGMRWKTFERLKKAESQAQNEIGGMVYSRFGLRWN